MLSLEQAVKKTDKKVWTPNRPLREIENEEVRNIFVEEAKYLLNDLETNYLETGYRRDPPETGPIVERIATTQNPEWYKTLWRGYIYYYKNIGRRKIKRKKQFKRRKPDSYIRRKYGIVPALTRIINQKDKARIGEKGFPKNGYTWDYVLRDLIFGRLTKGYEEGGRYFPPNKKVCNWYGIKINKKDYTDREKENFKEAMNFFDRKSRR